MEALRREASKKGIPLYQLKSQKYQEVLDTIIQNKRRIEEEIRLREASRRTHRYY